jgi:hypothetical protein
MKLIIQYTAINPKHGKVQHYLKEVTQDKYVKVYLASAKAGQISNLEILQLS